MMRVVDQMMDLVWAGLLGTKHIAGIGVAQQYTQMAWTARQGIDTAQRAMVSRAIGMGDVALAEHAVFQASTVTMVFFVFIATIGVVFTEPLLRLLGVSESVIDEASLYMRIQFLGQGVIGFQNLTGHALAASGDVITPMRATMVSRFLHMGLSPLLVFGPSGDLGSSVDKGLFFIPDLEIAGAALASMIANAVGMSMNLRSLFTGRSKLHLRWSNYRFDPALIWQVLRIGGPAAINGAERSVAQLILVRFVTPFGDNALAAFTLTRRVEMFANLGSQGVGQASGVIVGQNLGAGKPDRAKQTIKWAVGYVLGARFVTSTLLFTFPTLFMSLFTRETDVLSIAATWVQIQVFGHFAMGIAQVGQQSFMTAGATVFPMVVTLVALWCVELPLAYFLSNAMDSQFGIAWAMTIAMFFRALPYIPYYYMGRWLNVSVFRNLEDKDAKPPDDRAEVEAQPVLGA
jgi:putative MATE family efflux protein